MRHYRWHKEEDGRSGNWVIFRGSDDAGSRAGVWILRNWKQGKPDIYCSVKEAACGWCISEGYGYTGRLVLLCGLWSWDLSDQSFYCNFWKCNCNSVLY